MSVPYADDRRAWRIRLAHVRQELLSPVNAMLGFAEIVREEATRQGRQDMLGDVDRILGAARDLANKVDQLIDGDAARASAGPAQAVRVQQLRHDLLTPLNAIKGYGEMLREDAAEADCGSLPADLDRVLTAATDLLQRLDRIIHYSVDIDGASQGGDQQGQLIVGDLLRSLGPAREEPSAVTGPGAILVVDDIEANRDLLLRRLARDGHRVVAAAGGQQALQALTNEEFDLVLLDLMMPDINGFDVLLRMKADERLRRVPVIMITALAESEAAIRCIEAGAEDYLPKPFDPVLLRARINACLHKKHWRDREQQYLRRIESETAKFERLLLNILPSQVIHRLNQGETLIADRFDAASVLFADILGFTAHAARTAPQALVEYLNRLYSAFDALALRHGVEKIKTIGDAYMVAAGLPDPRPDHVMAIAGMALDMLDELDHVNRDFGWPLQMRIGIHAGPVVAGIVGTHRSIYDLWGDTVNIAHRLEATSLPNHIHISAEAACHLANIYSLEPRGRIDIKGRGQLASYFLKRP